MSDDVLDMDEAMRLLRKTVANKGTDYVYEPPGLLDDGQPHCVYVHNGEPSCVVGHALLDYGVSYESLKTASDYGFGAWGLNGRFSDLAFSEEAESVLSEAQREQDALRPWGDALDAAESRYRELGGTG